MTPSGSGPRSTAVRRRVASGCLDHDHGRTRYVVGRLTRRQLRSWTVRLRAAHLSVAVRLGEWWDDALACLPAGAGSGGPTGPSDEARVGRRSHGAWAVWRTLSAHPGDRLSAVGGESDAAGAGDELRWRDLAVVAGVDDDRVGNQWAKLLSERMQLRPPPNLRTKRPRRPRRIGVPATAAAP